ncbi:MAG TPA: Xaa-Pro aminopeptidase [Roseiarcus sp.]
MPIALRDVVVPDFGIPVDAPRISGATYEARCRDAYARAKCDWLVVYADREHLANIAFLSGYDPRFEEALLLLGPQSRRILVVGNEGEGYAPLAGLPGLDIALAQSLSLMGQDRSLQPDLAAVLREAGMSRGGTIGLVGWKYFEPAEWDDAFPGLFVPHYLVTMLSRIAGGADGLKDRTPVLMHPTTGLRSTIDADQVALHEWGAARASAAVWRIASETRLGRTEYEAASVMGYAGEVLSAHVMYATGDSSHPAIGLRSPSGRIIRRGDGVTAGVGFWGGLSARAGLIAEHDEAFLTTAATYFDGLIAWYEAADIGVAGEAVFAAVTERLARGGLRSALNPGHLTGHDEWIHTPIRPGSPDRIASGMPFQVDIIPTPMRAGWALNCEDGVVFADAALRAELKARHPAVVERIEARRTFVGDDLGIPIKDAILPLSSTPLCLPPFWLASGRLLVRA